MKRLLISLLMILSLLIGFQQAIIVLHFKLNQKEIEAAFCVNKDEPMMHCHGACFLRKQLKNTEEKGSVPSTVYSKVDLMTVPIIEFEVRDLIIDVGGSAPVYQEICYEDPFREVIVPPPIG